MYVFLNNTYSFPEQYSGTLKQTTHQLVRIPSY